MSTQELIYNNQFESTSKSQIEEDFWKFTSDSSTSK